MTTLRKSLLGLGIVAASSLGALHAAQALTPPTAIEIDGGPFGQLELSGGADGYGYVTSGLADHEQDNGINLGSMLIELQKSTGVLQFNIQIGSVDGAYSPGSVTGRPAEDGINYNSTGPLYVGSVTIAPPGQPFTLTAGRLGSVEGYEYGTDWNNPSQFVSAAYWVENGQYNGVSGNYTKGPLSATVTFGDGWDTHVFNFMQSLVSYTFNSSNILSLYYGGNLGRTGLNARTYSWADNTTVEEYGAYFINSQTMGAYYMYTAGNLSLTPEVQYVYSHTDHVLGIDKTTANFAAVLFGSYTFDKTLYSVGGWVEYENSKGAGYWFVGPQSEGIGFAVSPAWQYKYLFARVNAGGFYLTNNKYDGASYGYGNNGEGKFQFTGTLQAGVLF